MYLQEFFDYKNQLMEDLLTTPEIVKLIRDDCEPMEHPEELAYVKVFPHEYVPETIEHGATYICFDVDIQRSMNKTFLLPTLQVWLFTHKSKLRLPEGGLRTDALASAIAEKINGSRFYGLGELDLYSVKRFAPISDYHGKVLTFYATEFNRTSPTKKPIPNNRKTV